jgi:hypothetical protein
MSYYKTAPGLIKVRPSVEQNSLTDKARPRQQRDQSGERVYDTITEQTRRNCYHHSLYLTQLHT